MTMANFHIFLSILLTSATSTFVSGEVNFQPNTNYEWNHDETIEESTIDSNLLQPPRKLRASKQEKLKSLSSIFNAQHHNRQLHQLDRTLQDETCIPHGELCESASSSCCQGGCSEFNHGAGSGIHSCFCQANNEMCFNRGEEDYFCCSNRCGTNGLCECIPEGGSCVVGDGFCCGGLVCGEDGECAVPETESPTSLPTTDIPTSVPTDAPTTAFPTEIPTKTPTIIPTSVPTYSPSNTPPTKSPTQSPTPKPTAMPVDPAPKPTVTLEQHEVIDIFKTLGTERISQRDCPGDRQKVTIEIKTDKWGGDTGWFISNMRGRKFHEVLNGTYGEYDSDVYDLCVKPGRYNFTITDVYKDGLCCKYGDGYFKVYINDHEVLFMRSFQAMVTEVLNVGYDPTPKMTERHHMYLYEHNRRRKDWHLKHGLSYVPLAWSPALAEESRRWAVQLLKDCDVNGIEHEPHVAEGENLAKNVGMKGWGQLYPPTNIVGRWVEWEINWPYPKNAHLTQALWRSSKYMGCGESHKLYKGGHCRVQVCRYTRAGNCDMAKYNSTEGKNWLEPMLEGASKCGPNCAKEGCYAPLLEQI